MSFLLLVCNFINHTKYWNFKYFRTKLFQVFTLEEIEHILLPRAKVVNTYVIEVILKIIRLIIRF